MCVLVFVSNFVYLHTDVYAHKRSIYRDAKNREPLFQDPSEATALIQAKCLFQLLAIRIIPPAEDPFFGGGPPHESSKMVPNRLLRFGSRKTTSLSKRSVQGGCVEISWLLAPADSPLPKGPHKTQNVKPIRRS